MSTPEAAAALPPALLDWWFAPWSYALQRDLPSLASGLVAQRDAYRLWCEQHGIAPDFPGRYQAGWHVAALSSSRELLRSCSLYGGLFAARDQKRNGLEALPPEWQKWCLKVALTQPLQALSQNQEQLQQRGMSELACRLERGFPGMWRRLALLLPPDQAQQINRALPPPQAAVAADMPDSSDGRALRCWRLCLEYVRRNSNAAG